jgi:YtcA family
MPASFRSRLPLSAMLIAFLLTGCGRAPSFNILGSYFPAWLVCILAGVAMASVIGALLAKFNMQHLIRWTIFVYPCLSAAIAFTLWLLFFS